ncbi:YdiK family protein [Bacillus manliponensis]|uniref:YdiK family protein n=1 Tax=Bacillus manliponensis TaxID=574376 RepID=UPI003513DE65
MRTAPMFMATLYFLLGCVFTYLAVTSVQGQDTIWNFYTLLLAGMATIDFNLALRLIIIKLKNKDKQEQ